MNRNAQKKFSPQGYSSLIAVIWLFVMSFTGTTLIEMTSTDVRVKSQELQTAQALQVGNGGIQYALEKIKSGLNPGNVTKNLGEGSFTILTDPGMSKITVRSTVGEAQKEQAIETDFAGDCVEIDINQVAIDNTILKKINLRKTCLDTVILTDISLAWSAGTIEPITEIQINATSVYGPAGSGLNGQTIDITDQAINDQGWHQLDYHFSQPIPTPNIFTLKLYFKDGSEKTQIISLLP